MLAIVNAVFVKFVAAVPITPKSNTISSIVADVNGTLASSLVFRVAMTMISCVAPSQWIGSASIF